MVESSEKSSLLKGETIQLRQYRQVFDKKTTSYTRHRYSDNINDFKIVPQIVECADLLRFDLCYRAKLYTHTQKALQPNYSRRRQRDVIIFQGTSMTV